MDFETWKRKRLRANPDLEELAGGISSYVDDAADNAALPDVPDGLEQVWAPSEEKRKPLVAASSPQTESGDDADERDPANEGVSTEERAALNDPRASASNTDMRQAFDRMSNIFLTSAGLPPQATRGNPYKDERDSMRDWLLKRRASARASESTELQRERTGAYLAATAAQRERDAANAAARAEAEGRKADAERARLELDKARAESARLQADEKSRLERDKLELERRKFERKGQKGPAMAPKGFPAGWELEGKTQPTPKQGEQFEGLVYSSEKMKGLTAQMRKELAAAGGSRVLPGPTRSRLQQLAKEIQIEGKNIAELGALSGPDYSLMEAIAADPTKLDSFAKDMPALLSGLEKWGDNSVSAKAKSLGARRVAPLAAGPKSESSAARPPGVKVRRKSDGAVKTLTPEQAAQVLKSPAYEKVE